MPRDGDPTTAESLEIATIRSVLTDFGLARGDAHSKLTQSGIYMGTAHYMSPEQAMGGIVGPASDVYSLGALLYETLTATTPVTGENVVVILSRIASGDWKPAGQLLNDLPGAVDALVASLMAMEKQARPSAAEVVGLIDRLLHEP